MPNRVQTWVIHDSDPEKKGATRIKRKDAPGWNKKGFGIFHTLNEFSGPRKKENLVWINAWAVDIDKGDKQDMQAIIEKGLIPTMVVETKSGYHVYWAAKDGTKENWDAIVKNRLVPFYGADKNARDLCRLLRTPGFNHLKDPNSPFAVKIVWSGSAAYSEMEMLMRYPDVEKKKEEKREKARLKKESPGSGLFWENVYNLDCEYALGRLSGTAHVNGEVYEFRPNASGTRNIFVNGKTTGCWIDCDRRIGSLDQGGPTIAQWLNWFHKDYIKTVEIIKEVFPECLPKQMALL